MAMILATGAAFNLDEMIINFPMKKLSVTCEECKNIIKDPHRNILIKRIFRECLKLVINDIIDNNITFWLPTKARKCNIHMKRVDGQTFKNLRKSGKWKDVDLLSSSFTGYELGFYMYGVRDPRIKNIYVNKSLKDRITQNTNNGMQYGDSKNDKYVSDYYEQIHQLFPKVLISDIKRILNFCWKSLYLHNSYGGDTFIKDKDIWCYIGFLKKDSLKYFKYYIKKLSLKIRVLYRRNKIPWDGYYYFALGQNQYDSCIGTKKRGRPKKIFTFTNIMLYQILDECKITESGKQYIFKIPYINYIKYKFFVEKLTTDKAELIITRDPLKFKDILVNDNEYEFL